MVTIFVMKLEMVALKFFKIFEMTLKQVCNISNNQLIIDLPKDFYGKKKVMVIVEDLEDLILEKIIKMQKASSDPLFLLDINEVNEDFKLIDNESL